MSVTRKDFGFVKPRTYTSNSFVFGVGGGCLPKSITSGSHQKGSDTVRVRVDVLVVTRTPVPHSDGYFGNGGQTLTNDDRQNSQSSHWNRRGSPGPHRKVNVVSGTVTSLKVYVSSLGKMT